MLRVLVGFAVAAVTVTSAEAQTRSFKDWQATCEKSACIGRTIAPNGALAASTFELKRDSRPGTDWEVIVRLSADLPANARLQLSIDGQDGPLIEPVDYSEGPRGLSIVSPGVLRTLVPQLRNASTLGLAIGPDNQRKAVFSLAGLAATLLWIDERQGRLPEEAKASAGTPPEIQQMLKAEPDCVEQQETSVETEVAAADQDRTLYIVPCWQAAYNAGFILAMKSGGELERLTLPTFSKGAGWSEEKILINPSYDARSRTLVSFYKGRGLGDCGTLSEWRLSAKGFVLVKIQAEDECNGRTSEQWPVVFEAR